METKEYRLTDVCDFQGGTQPPKEEWINEPREGYIRMLQIRDFTQDKAEHIGYVKNTKKLNKCNEDDILIGRYGASVGKILTGLSGAYNVAIIKTIPNQNLISKKYLFYLLSGSGFQNFIKTIGSRAAQAGFNKDDLSYFKFHLPISVDDQERIAGILEMSNGLLQSRIKSISLIDEFLQFKFIELFGDPTKNEKKWPLDNLGNTTFKITDGEHLNPKLTDEGFNLIMAKDVLDDRVDFSQNNFVSEKDFIKFTKKCNPEKEDILLVSRGATIGRCVVVKEEKRFCLMGSVILIKPNQKKLTSDFINFLFKNKNFKEKLVITSGSSAQQAIYLSGLKKVKTIVPSTLLQQDFSNIVRKVEILKTHFNQSKSNLELLFKSISKKAFSGKLQIFASPPLQDFIKSGSEIPTENIAINKINKEFEEFYNTQVHTGATPEIDNKIRQLETELKIKGEIPFWDEYVKYRIVKGKFKTPFTFDQLWQEITKFPFETVPRYDEIANMIFNWLKEETPFLKQNFGKEKNQIELIVNETAQA